MVEWAGVARGVSARLFVAVTMGPRLYLSAADRQIGSITMQRGRAVCLGWLWHPPLGGILMSSPGTSIGHLTSWGEQGHPNTHIPPLSKTLSELQNYRKYATGSKSTTKYRAICFDCWVMNLNWESLHGGNCVKCWCILIKIALSNKINMAL